jgi:hypothetical protein
MQHYGSPICSWRILRNECAAMQVERIHGFANVVFEDGLTATNGFLEA